MKFSTNKVNLLNALEVSGKGLGKGNSTILNSLLLEIEDGKVTVTGGDTECSISSNFITMDYEVGSAILDPAIIEWVKKLDKDSSTIAVELSSDKKSIIVKSGKSSSTMSVIDGQYPKFDTDIDKKEIKINLVSSEFKMALQETIYAIAQDETRPILTGSLFDLQDSFLTIVSLDGFRMSTKRIATDAETTYRNKSVIPKKIVDKLLKLLKNDESNVELTIGKNNIVFKIDDNTIIKARLLEGEYIPYEKLLATEDLTQVKFKREALRSAISRASLMGETKEKSSVNLVKFELLPNKIIISSATSSRRACEEIEPLEHSGNPELTIAFNSKYWLDILNSMENENILVHFSSAEKPIIIEKVDDIGFIGLVLPVRLAAK